MNADAMLQHIIELKAGQASLMTMVSGVQGDVGEIKKEMNSNDGGIKKRITSLEHDRTRVSAYAACVSLIVALAAKFIPGSAQ